MKYKKYHIKRILRELQTNVGGSDSSSSDYEYVNFVDSAVKDDEILNHLEIIPAIEIFLST